MSANAETPRRLIVVRHAKADWPSVADHDRPLADRGRRDAPLTGRWLFGAGLVPDLALCSTAERTRETWKLITHEFPERPRTVYEERVYEASVGELVAVVDQTPDEVRTLLLLGHNPGVQGLSETLAGSADDEAMARLRRGFPTSGVAVLEFDTPWKRLEPGTARLSHFVTPSA